MPRLTVLAVTLLAACAPLPDVGAFRTASAPIYSNAALDLSRLEGNWQQVATFGAVGPDCPAGTVVFEPGSAGLVARSNLCLAGRVEALSGPVTPAGPGRFAIAGGEPWWVLWIDADARTMAIGTPSGAFGFILNRDGPIPQDRLAAAKDILAFNGYDAARISDY